MASTHGHLKNKNSNRISQAKPSVSGYVKLSLTDDDDTKRTISLHVVIAETFIEKPDDNFEYVVDHINRDRSDNNIRNLRWASRSDNSLNRESWKRKGIPVYQILPDGTELRWEKISDAAKATGTYISSITACCKNTRDTAGGYAWRYCENSIEGEEWKQLIIDGKDTDIYMLLHLVEYGNSLRRHMASIRTWVIRV